MAEAVRRELERRRRIELRRSLRNPHAQSVETAELGMGDWPRELPGVSAEDLVDLRSGMSVCWVPGEGWVEEQ